jgi:CRP-like cAMP-binding protein
MNALSNWSRNRLLLALPARNLRQLMPELEHIRCQSEQVLMDADSSLDHVFFPDSGVVSVVAVYADGNIIEMATIGREGFTGVQAVFGAKKSSARLLVQIPGSAAKMSHAAFTRAIMPSFRNLVRLRAGLSRTGHGVGSMQRCAQPQGTAGALAAHDA